MICKWPCGLEEWQVSVGEPVPGGCPTKTAPSSPQILRESSIFGRLVHSDRMAALLLLHTTLSRCNKLRNSAALFM